MSLSDERLIVILGAPRSGTTWLAKIFDSHPDVLYRHEPDTVRRCDDLPYFCDRSAIAPNLDLAQRYIATLIASRSMKVSGSLPVFRKSYRTRSEHWARLGLISGIRVAQLLGGNRWLERLPVPEFINGRQNSNLRIALKSVSSLGRAGLYAAALPRSRIILMIRDPCGQVTSMLTGTALGKFERPLLEGLLATEQAKNYALTRSQIAKMSLAEQYTWYWVILNEKALDDLAGSEQVRILRYDVLCLEPLKIAQDLFAFAGLDWPVCTANFLHRSVSYHGTERYYQVFRDTPSTLLKWERQLSRTDHHKILNVVRNTRFGDYWLNSPGTGSCFVTGSNDATVEERYGETNRLGIGALRLQ